MAQCVMKHVSFYAVPSIHKLHWRMFMISSSVCVCVCVCMCHVCHNIMCVLIIYIHAWKKLTIMVRKVAT